MLLDNFEPSEIVKAYIELMRISEPKLTQLMTQIEINSAHTVEEVATSIQEWSQKVDILQNAVSLEENLENHLTIVQVDKSDTAYSLLEDFFSELRELRKQEPTK